MSIRALVRLAATIASLALHTMAGVIVVDPQGQAGSPVLKGAIDAAAAGDILFVRAGVYGTPPAQPYIAIRGKGLALVEDSDSSPPVALPALEIAAIPHASKVIVRGFEIVSDSQYSFFQPGVSCVDDDGSVWIEDCTIRGDDAPTL